MYVYLNLTGTFKSNIWGPNPRESFIWSVDWVLGLLKNPQVIVIDSWG